MSETPPPAATAKAASATATPQTPPPSTPTSQLTPSTADVSSTLAAVITAVHHCAVCGVAASKRCAKCRAVHYCSAEHQKSDWPTHKRACKPPPPSKVPPAARTTAVVP